MKRYIAIITCLVVCQVTLAQKSVDQLFSEFSKEKSVVSVHLGKVMLGLASLFTETMGVNGVEVLEFEDCSPDVKNRFVTSIKELKDPKFETMVTSNENDCRTKVLVRIEEEMIREMVVLTTGNSNALVRIKGKIKPSDIERVMKKHGNG